MEQRTVAIGGLALNIAEAGVGGRPLLVLHGFAGGKEDFTEWLDPLAAVGWHAVVPDHRGHGASDKPASDDAYSFSFLADDALALADSLGWERFALLGHSMGGMVAQLMAVSSPQRLSGLILMDTSHGSIEGLDSELVTTVVTIVREQGMDALANLIAEYGSALDTPAHLRLVAERPDYAAFGERKLRATSPHVYAAMVPRLVDTPDRLDNLSGLPAGLPVLVMVGEQDAPFLGSSERMAAAIPGAVLAVIADAGHSPQFENPPAWWAVLSAFLERIP
jgi:pimeloyl-ACP methyl ester carboxylesterase